MAFPDFHLPAHADLPRPPAPGAVCALPTVQGSGDALLIAALARQQTGEAAMLAVITAQAQDAARLTEELQWFAPELRVALLVDWETLPYDPFSPHQDLVSERLATLYELQSSRVDVLVVAATTALHRLAPPAFVAAHTFWFDRGQTLDQTALLEQLNLAGYENVSQVVRPGEYCVRGGLIDLFPMGATLPCRLDLFGSEIESIRSFDPDTQRSLYPVERIRLLPGREFPMDEAARTAFRGRWRERFEGDPSRAGPYRDIGNGITPAGIEYWLPLFFEGTASLFDYLPRNARVLGQGDLEAECRRFGEEAAQRHRFFAHDAERPLLRPDELFLDTETFFRELRRFGRYALRAAPQQAAVPPALCPALPALAIERRAEQPLGRIAGFIESHQTRVLVVAESNGRLETLAQLFAEHGFELPVFQDWGSFVRSHAGLGCAVGPVASGFVCPEALARASQASGDQKLREPQQADEPRTSQVLALVTETELFAGAPRRSRRRGREAVTDVDTLIRDLSELKPGDPVVHSDHGIGRYQGLINLDLGDGPGEFLHLTYAQNATLYVPVAQLHLIGRYTGASPDEAPLHQLGSGQWEKARRKAAQQARDTAAELLNLYARRAARQGHAFGFEPRDYEAFAEGFGFDETPDQLAAIHAVVQDLVSDKPMDRLICGDVGFGKTEVALRAAFIAAAGGRQVALLCPTTLLAEQHFATFSDRFSAWPFRLAELSRFRSARESRVVLDGLADGRVDIVIGTHKLLSRDVRFARLGLVIIDEEHRFGVRQKEALKALRAEVDVLTLTATPIPRTLAMSLEGIRDFSVIATAPQKRLAIKTFVRRESDSIIREALLRELRRGGQAYFLHNEVDTIQNRLAHLEKLLPEARIAVAHGQMPERELERVMRDFHQQRANVLLCTTIIETGIDVPTANTIVMHRADRFGLAQLHQLRGRVGRSHHQAYAYLLIPDETAITRDAVKRLEAIQMMEELGSGFFLAMHDLEIRGAGEVLGDSQSGEVQEVGFGLYADMLNRAVRALKAGQEPDLSAPLAAVTEINLHVPALLPADYCPDVHERLALYKRLAHCDAPDVLIDLREELVDRFGRLPESALALFETHRLRLQAEPLGIARIDASADALTLQFVARPPIAPETIIRFIQSRRDARLSGQDRMRIETHCPDLASRTQRLREILSALGAPAPSTAGKT